jgi:hypothetical protein
VLALIFFRNIAVMRTPRAIALYTCNLLICCEYNIYRCAGAHLFGFKLLIFAPLIHRAMAHPCSANDQRRSVIGDYGATWTSRRDHLPPGLLYNKGVRVSEIIGVKLADVVLDGAASCIFAVRGASSVRCRYANQQCWRSELGYK